MSSESIELTVVSPLGTDPEPSNDDNWNVITPSDEGAALADSGDICVRAEYSGSGEEAYAVSGEGCEENTPPTGGSGGGGDPVDGDDDYTGDPPDSEDNLFKATYDVTSDRELGLTVRLPITRLDGELSLDCGDGTTKTVNSGRPTCDYSTPGEYTLVVEGSFGRFGWATEEPLKRDWYPSRNGPIH